MDSSSYTCLLPNITAVEQQCRTFQYHVIKEINIPSLKHLMSLNATTGPTVLHLVRDPRGTYNSIIRMSHYEEEMKDYASTCRQMQTDLEHVMGGDYNYDYRLVRYEDIALDTERYTEALYKAVGLQNSSLAMDWVKEATSDGDEDDFFTTRKYSKSVPFQWSVQLSLGRILWIEDVCKDVMMLLGYKLVGEMLLNEGRTRTEPVTPDLVLTDVDVRLRDVTIR